MITERRFQSEYIEIRTHMQELAEKVLDNAEHTEETAMKSYWSYHGRLLNNLAYKMGQFDNELESSK